ncbi:MAG: helix-turn-helix transcriptional regulator [Lachnospiraceae bacterium]|nr:helix-turn-helix transcriptional regulator [Lachnospiraceae bacterium]
MERNLLKEAASVYENWNSERELEHYQLLQSEEEKDHSAVVYEQIILECVRNGDTEGMRNFVKELSAEPENVGVVAKTDFKQREYLAVSLITLITRAAIEGGLSEEEARQLGDIFLQRIAGCAKADEISLIALRAQYEFAERVAEVRTGRSRSSLVERCKEYIAKNLRKELKVEDIAPAIGFSRTYLSRKFSEKEGKTIRQYIMEQRVIHAANLLKFSDYPIALVSEYFCFSSQSHFGRHFKAYYGMTPKEYRDRFQRTDHYKE